MSIRHRDSNGRRWRSGNRIRLSDCYRTHANGSLRDDCDIRRRHLRHDLVRLGNSPERGCRGRGCGYSSLARRDVMAAVAIPAMAVRAIRVMGALGVFVLPFRHNLYVL